MRERETAKVRLERHRVRETTYQSVIDRRVTEVLEIRKRERESHIACKRERASASE